MSAAIGWWLMAAGFLSGCLMGILAQDEAWLGGYSSRPRRLVRLGHIALVALGALNVAWSMLSQSHTNPAFTSVIGGSFLVGGLTMGPTCFITAWQWPCRFLFVIPATSLFIGAVLAGWSSLP